MSALGSFRSAWSPRVLSILRIIVAFLFIAHGTQKLLNFPPATVIVPFELMTLRGVQGILEAFAGALLLLLGLFTRPIGFLLCGDMAFAYFMAHAPQNFWPILNKGDLAVTFCFVFLYLAAAGGGPWSLDHALGRDKS